MKRLLYITVLTLAFSVMATTARAQGAIRVAVGTSFNQLDPALTTIDDVRRSKKVDLQT